MMTVIQSYIVIQQEILLIQQVIKLYHDLYINRYNTHNIIHTIHSGQCQIAAGTSRQYVCNGTEVNLVSYDSGDCSGDPSRALNNICGLYPDGCTAVCDRNDCDGISIVVYTSPDCSGDIFTKINYLTGICSGTSVLSAQATCIGGQVQLITYYGISNCSGTPTTSDIQGPTCVASGGVSVKYSGCSSCVTFKLFGAVVIAFITSLF